MADFLTPAENNFDTGRAIFDTIEKRVINCTRYDFVSFWSERYSALPPIELRTAVLRLWRIQEVIMANVVGAITINAAFLQEIKEDNIDLRRAFSNVATAFAKLAEESVEHQLIYDAATFLRDQVAMHFALEEFFGYIEVAAMEAPRLQNKAEDLHAQHELLYLEICDLVESVEKWLYHEPNADRTAVLQGHFSEFHARFTEHEHQENELIVSAMDDDIGVGD